MTAEEVCDVIYRSNLERKFEEGKIDGRQLTAGLSKALRIELDEAWLRPIWADMFTENTEVSALVRKLAPHHELMILSNTNAWHWHFARENFPIVAEIDNAVVSYEVGVLKPHPRIYEAALAKADPSLPIIFIDDIKVNAEAADRHGINGIHFVTADQLERELKALDCL
jgi:HAD superfamily hydrolase (TIGR01509 family)